jgi:N-acetylneuraminic acid mutarotase
MHKRFLVKLLILIALWFSTTVAVQAHFRARFQPCKNPVPVTMPSGTWEPRTPPALFRSETSAAVLDGKIYIAGGLAGKSTFYTEITTSFEVYNPATNAWKALAPLPKALHHMAIAGARGRIYMTGGYTALDFIANNKSAWAYDPVVDSWSAIADLPAPRAAHTLAVIDDTLYLVGGITSASPALWTYDPVADKWNTKHAPMPTAREHTSSAVVDGKLYVIGGETPNSDGTGRETYQTLSAIESYDPATDKWSSLTDAPTARSSITAGVLDGKIHVVSGENHKDNCVFANHEVYDPKTDTWTQAAELTTARHGAVSGVIENRWYVIGGATNPGLLTIASLSQAAEVFVPQPK